MTMSGMTSERLEELRRIAEAATPGPWGMNPENGLVDEAATLTPVCGMVWVRTEEQTLANAMHIASFDPSTVLVLLDEIERLRREREAALDILSRKDIGDGAKVEGVRLILKGGDRERPTRES